MTVYFQIDEMISESSPQTAYNVLNGNPLTLWSGKRKVIDMTFVWDRTKAGEVWGPWYLNETYSEVSVDLDLNIKLRRYEFGLWETLSFDTGGFDDYNPSAAIDMYNKMLLVAWENQEGAPDNKNVYGHLVNLQNFQPYGTMIDISAVQYDQTSPRVAFDTVNQRYMVVWEDARNTATNISNMDVFGQFVDPQGQLSGANFPVTTNTSNQIAPAVAFGDFDASRFLIAWKAGRNAGNSDPYAQLWEFSTAPQLEITDDLDQPIYNQTMDFGGIDVGLSSTKKFRIWNRGNAPLTVTAMTGSLNVALATNPTVPFNVPTPQPGSINPGSFYEMDVRFTPPGAFTYSGPDNTVTIETNGGSTVLYFSGYGIGTDPVITTATLPNGAASLDYYAEIQATGGATPYTWSLLSGALPPELSLDGATGIISGTAPITTGTYDFEVQVMDAGGKSAVQAYTIIISDMVITTTTMLDGSVGSAYSEPINAAGGSPNYTWSIIAGSLPSTLDFSSPTTATPTVDIVGTPSAIGTYNFTVQVTDGGALTATQDLSITVSSDLTINDVSPLVDGHVGEDYSHTIGKVGGTPPYNWSILAGALPTGLTLDPNTGRISGQPTTIGTYDFVVQLEDLLNVQVNKTFSITITDITILTETLPVGSTATPYYETLTATGGTGTGYQWSDLGGLPPGLLLSIGGIIDGTPTAVGTYTFTVKVKDSANSEASKQLTIIISDMSITTSTLPNATISVPYENPG
ncbi:MAG: putative Ig domain-containing protein, partial [Planctomycetota bacterium]